MLYQVSVSNQMYTPHSSQVLKGMHKEAGSKLFILRNRNYLFSSFQYFFLKEKKKCPGSSSLWKNRTKNIYITKAENVV